MHFGNTVCPKGPIVIIILLLAYSLLELVAVLSKCSCSECNKKQWWISRWIRVIGRNIFKQTKFSCYSLCTGAYYDFHCKMCNNNMFFHSLKITQPTNALIVCHLFLNHIFKTLSLFLHVSIAYRLSSSGSTYIS